MKQKEAGTILASFPFSDFHPESTCATMRATRADEAPVYSRSFFSWYWHLHESH